MLASANIRALGYIPPLVLPATPTIQKLNKTLYNVSLGQHSGTRLHTTISIASDTHHLGAQ